MRLVIVPVKPGKNGFVPSRIAVGVLCLCSVLVLSLRAASHAAGKGTVDTPAATRPAPTVSNGDTSWPSFRNGFDLLGVAASPLPEKLEQLWKFPTGEMVVSTAAIVDGRVYVASLSGKLFCLNLKTGEQIWSYRSIASPDPKEFAPGFKASPTVTADSVYLGDEDGVFHCLDRETGKQKWEPFKTGAEIVSSACLYKDKVLFGSHDNILYCLNTSDGKLAWKFTTQGPVNCTPAIIGNRTFVTGCDEHLRVINIDKGTEETDIHLGTYLIASPAVVDNILYVGTYASEVVAVDWKAKKTVWAFKDKERDFPYHSCAAVTTDSIVVGGRDKRLHCLNRKTGEERWHFDTKGKIDSSPVVVGERVFFGSEDGNLYCANLSTGKEVWKFSAGRSISASPAVAEGRLVIGSESSDGFVYCFGAK